MFTEIERAYRKGLRERRFSVYYWPKALVIIVLTVVLVYGLGFQNWVVYTLSAAILLGFAIYFLVNDIHEILGSRPDLSPYAKLRTYFFEDDQVRIGNLLIDLHEHGLTEKNDLKLAIDYFERRRPVLTRPSLLEWVLSAIVALASLIIIVYDESTGVIDNEKLFTVLRATFELSLVVVLPILVVRLFMAYTDAARRKLDSILVEDLAYLYVNFEEYRAELLEIGDV